MAQTLDTSSNLGRTPSRDVLQHSASDNQDPSGARSLYENRVCTSAGSLHFRTVISPKAWSRFRANLIKFGRQGRCLNRPGLAALDPTLSKTFLEKNP